VSELVIVRAIDYGHCPWVLAAADTILIGVVSL
jgi:hypothetical protein